MGDLVTQLQTTTRYSPQVGREKSPREVGKAQSPHGTVLFVAVSFRFKCEVKRELNHGKEKQC